MTIRDMHYDFKQKLNKMDSQKYRNLKVPEIDWRLVEAQEIFVKAIAQPEKLNSLIGFEITQRTIDDIRTIVIDQKKGSGIKPMVYDTGTFIVTLPDDYWFYANGKAYCSKGDCTDTRCKMIEVEHDDEAEDSEFNKSSFEWREVNVRFNSEGIRLFTDSTFSIDEVVLSYLRQPKRIHNAADWQGGTYIVGGKILTGTQDCELPAIVHSEIVDLAVLITAGDLNMPIQAKLNKLSLTK